MYDQEIVIADLRNILWSIDQIISRFSVISAPMISDEMLKCNVSYCC